LLRWPRYTLYPLKSALTSPTSGGRSVSIVCWRTKPRSLVYYNKLSVGPTYFWFTACPSCQMSGYQSLVVVSTTAKLEKFQVGASCSRSKNEHMSRFECKNVTISFIRTFLLVVYSLQFSSLRERAHQGNWQPQRNRNFQELLSARAEHILLNGAAQI
jgi:hypothetical protein